MITARSKDELDKLKLLEREDCVLYAGPFRVKPGGLSVKTTKMIFRYQEHSEILKQKETFLEVKKGL